MEIKKLNENTTPVGNASKGSEKKFFAKMLDKLGISKFQGWIAERCDARDSKCTYVMHVSKEDQKIIEKVEAIADGINRGVVDGGVPVPYSRSKPGSKQPTAHESGKKFEPTYVMNVSKEDQEIIKQIEIATQHRLAERPLSMTVHYPNGVTKTIDLIGHPPPPYYPPEPGRLKKIGNAVKNFFAQLEFPVYTQPFYHDDSLF